MAAAGPHETGSWVMSGGPTRAHCLPSGAQIRGGSGGGGSADCVCSAEYFTWGSSHTTASRFSPFT